MGHLSSLMSCKWWISVDQCGFVFHELSPLAGCGRSPDRATVWLAFQERTSYLG